MGEGKLFSSVNEGKRERNICYKGRISDGLHRKDRVRK